MTSDFPGDVLNFVAENIRSVAQLETLLLLRAENCRQWSASEVSRALYTTAGMSAAHLAEFEAQGLVTSSSSADNGQQHYCYRPRTAHLERLVNLLADMYQQRRVSVITLIYCEPTDRVRSFADAFRLRKEK